MKGLRTVTAPKVFMPGRGAPLLLGVARVSNADQHIGVNENGNGHTALPGQDGSLSAACTRAHDAVSSSSVMVTFFMDRFALVTNLM